MNYTKSLIVLLLTGNCLMLYAGTDPNKVLSQDVIKRSVVSAGDKARLYHLFEKAKRGEPLTIGVIGGSVTEGAMASSADCKWGNRVAKWWRDSFIQVKVWTFVNAGIGATGSNIAAHRVKNDLLKYNPDLVIVELACNDIGISPPDIKETMEGLVRQILKMPNSPAVMFLFIMLDNGTNVQDAHAEIGKHYGLPMISYRDALWPEIQAGRIKWKDISADYVHPNDTGHKYCADLINAFLEDSLSHMPKDACLPEIRPLPDVLTSSRYEYTALLNYDTIKPVVNKGWQLLENGRFGRGWVSEIPGSILEFDIEASAVALSFFRIKRDMGMAEAQLDKEPPIKMNAHFDQTWGGYNVWQPVGKSTVKQKHRLRIKLLDAKDPNSTGHRFEINALFLAGVND
jgi:lysophospholipase L1-like esterase